MSHSMHKNVRVLSNEILAMQAISLVFLGSTVIQCDPLHKVLDFSFTVCRLFATLIGSRPLKPWRLVARRPSRPRRHSSAERSGAEAAEALAASDWWLAWGAASDSKKDTLKGLKD